MIRKGFQFYFESPTQVYALAPPGQTRYTVDLGGDDVLRIPHEIREGRESVPLPPTPAVADQVLSVRRTPEALNAEALHDICCHRSTDKINRTLETTVGYMPVKLPDYFCPICAQIKAKRRGLKHKVHICLNLEDAAPAESDFEDDNSDDAEDVSPVVELEYTAPVAGRALGIQPVPRFDVSTLRPFEIMFADNKDYEMPVRGGRQTTLALFDMCSSAKFCYDLFTKSENGTAIRHILVTNGVHNLPYKCRLYTDGCGSMVHAELAAIALGVDHCYVPPHEQSLNEAESICHLIWDDAAAIIQRHQAPSNLFAEAVKYALYADMRTATTAVRGFKTPYEILKGIKLSILKMHRWYTMAFVTVPRSKRKALSKKGFLGRAEMGRLMGFQGPYSTTWRVLLSGNRMVHSINVTFDDSNFIHGQKALKLPSASSDQTLGLHMTPNDSSGLNSAAAVSPLASSAAPNSSVPHTPVNFPDSHVIIEQCSLFDEVNQTVNEPEYFDITEGGSWLWTQDELQARPRPSYSHNFLVQVDLATRFEPIARDIALVLAVSIFTGQQGSKFDHGSISSASRFLALTAQKDIKWKQALAGPDSDKAIAALYSEKDSLLDTVLVKIDKDHPDYDTALAQAITGRFLLDIRRNGMWKARGVKQGFKENKQRDKYFPYV